MISVDEFGLAKAAPGQISVSSKRLRVKREYAPFDTERPKPGASITRYANGPTGTVFTFELVRVPNTGGHYHGGDSRHPLAAGTVTPPSVTLTGPYPQNVPVTITAPDVCGAINFVWKASGQTGGFLMEVMYDSFLPIPQSTGIALKAPEVIHPSPYWADPAFVEKLRQLGEQYRAKRKKDITITDASLTWGGRFDIDAAHPTQPKEWQAPHAEHRNGRQADVRLRDMNNNDKKAFKEICATLGITAAIHSGNHWHIRLPPTASKRKSSRSTSVKARSSKRRSASR